MKDLAIYFVNILAILLILMIVSFIFVDRNLAISEKEVAATYLNDIHFVIANNDQQTLIAVVKTSNGGPLLLVLDKDREGVQSVTSDHAAFWSFIFITLIVIFIPLVFWKYNFISMWLVRNKRGQK